MRREIVNVWTLLVCATVGCSATACGDSNAVAPLAAARVAGETESGVTALTWNVYLGADIGRVLQARTADEAVVPATEEWGHVQATDFPARAGALARAIAAQRAHVVGGQEVGLYPTTRQPLATAPPR